jgi:hypothetical protein
MATMPQDPAQKTCQTRVNMVAAFLKVKLTVRASSTQM